MPDRSQNAVDRPIVGVIVISPSVVRIGRRLCDKSRKIPYSAMVKEVKKVIWNPYIRTRDRITTKS